MGIYISQFSTCCLHIIAAATTQSRARAETPCWSASAMAAQVPHDRGDGLRNTSSEENPPKSYAEFISTLPTREGWSQPLCLYRNYWFKPEIVVGILHVPDMFKPRHDDIVLASQPKCGTTWLKALTFTVANRSLYSFSDHPLLTRNPHHPVPFIEIHNEGRDLTYIETLPSPRLLSTHLPLSLLPTSCGSRIIYLCREPKDAFVSRWHFENKLPKEMDIDLDKALAMFCEGFSPYGPFWNHYLEYWKGSLLRPNGVLFLKYEEIMSDPEKVVRKIAEFINVPFTKEEDKNGVVKEVVKLCSFEMLASLEVNKNGGSHTRNNKYVGHSILFRKGNVGDWMNHMSEEMGEKVDSIVKEKMGGSGLTF